VGCFQNKANSPLAFCHWTLSVVWIIHQHHKHTKRYAFLNHNNQSGRQFALMFILLLISAGENKPSGQICTTEQRNIAVLCVKVNPLHLIKHEAMNTHGSEAFVDLYTFI
jgi:hypothetical protein